jgi:peptidoglycan/LPS O-acetylase OafA/YrhL
LPIQTNKRARLQANQNARDDERYALLRSGRRIPELDGLRGVAISLVLIVHFFTAPAAVIRRPNPLAYVQILTRLSWSGVDLFFILSGFLIGGILIDARTSKNFFKIFYVRRACRILPIYLLFCCIAASLYHFVYPFHRDVMDWMFLSPMPWYSYLTFTQNCWVAGKNMTGPAVWAPTWSLAVEEQFYLTLPLIVRFVRQITLPYVLAAGILAAPLIRLAILVWLPLPQQAVYVLLPSRMDDLLMGVLTAWMVRKPEVWAFVVARRKVFWRAFFVLALGLPFLTLTSSMYSFPMASFGFDWLALFYLTALILVLAEPQSWLGRAMRWRWLMGLGTVAYGTYLIHVLVYGLCKAYFRHHGPSLESLPDLGVTLGALVLTIILAQLSWRLFEKHFVRMGHQFQYEPAQVTARHEERT